MGHECLDAQLAQLEGELLGSLGGTRRRPAASPRGAATRRPSPRSPPSRRSRAAPRVRGAVAAASSDTSRSSRSPASPGTSPPCSQRPISCGLPTVAESPIRWIGRPANRSTRASTPSRCHPRSEAANACSSSTTTARSAGEEPVVVDAARDEHRLERLGRGQQDVRRLGEDALAGGVADVAVPEPDATTQPVAVLRDSWVQVVQQGPQRRHVEDGEPAATAPAPSRTAAGRRRPRSFPRQSARSACSRHPIARARRRPPAAGGGRASPGS